MKGLAKRILLALFAPPILGAFLLQLYTVAASGARETPAAAPWAEQLLLFLLLACYGFVFCVVPGIAFWGILEAGWRYAGTRFRERRVFSLAGGGLGALAGVAIGKGFLAQPGSRYETVGLLVGLVTAAWIRRCHPRTSPEPGS
jgi:hypothetical protein